MFNILSSRTPHESNAKLVDTRRVTEQSKSGFDREQEMQEIDAKLKSLELLIKNAIWDFKLGNANVQDESIELFLFQFNFFIILHFFYV